MIFSSEFVLKYAENQAMRCASPPKTTQNQQNSAGNAIVIILVMIALIAFLTAVAMRMSSRTSTNMDQEQARIQAAKLIQVAKSYESGVQDLIIAKRCSENEISFENTLTTKNYTNPSSPSDLHCNMFDGEGAALRYNNLATEALDPSNSSKSDYGEWVFTGTQCVLGVGSDDDDHCDEHEVALILAAPHIRLEICRQINKLNGITNPTDEAPGEIFDSAAVAFKGTFTTSSATEIGDSTAGTGFVGHPTGCFKSESGSWSGSYVFYSVLLAR
jgi:type II secretory pathway pseudopilin PulG